MSIVRLTHEFAPEGVSRMGTLKQYFETDFPYAIRVYFVSDFDPTMTCALLYDIAGFSAWISCYVSGAERGLDFYRGLVKQHQYGKTQVTFTGHLTLPAVVFFPGEIKVRTTHNLEITYRLFGDPSPRSVTEIPASKRFFIYSESNLLDNEISELQAFAETSGHMLQFRSQAYVKKRTEEEEPLAFICHDSRDKEAVARRIAANLQGLLCPVWYDEFSLQVGDNLRESIEKGLKRCKKCVLILSSHFFSNKGWTKKEFETIFAREIHEGNSIVLPVWHGVTKEEVYEYCPSLSNVMALDWAQLSEKEVCRQLRNAIVA